MSETEPDENTEDVENGTEVTFFGETDSSWRISLGRSRATRHNVKEKCHYDALLVTPDDRNVYINRAYVGTDFRLHIPKHIRVGYDLEQSDGEYAVVLLVEDE